MMIHEITVKAGKHRRRKRIGRGPGSGTGKTAGRGHKGAGSRAGFSGSQVPGFEGGQMPYFRRIPKRGFSNAMFKKIYATINIRSLEERFESGDEVNTETLRACGLIRNVRIPVKILGDGEITKKLTVSAAKFTASAQSKIESAGGTCNVI